jgi:hypothetical protein
MPFGNYTELQAAIADHLDRDDLTAQIPDFIYLAEISIAEKLDLEQSLLVVTGNLVSGQDYVPLPADCFEPRSLQIDSPTPSTPDIVGAAEWVRFRSVSPGFPALARVRGVTQLALSPTPDGNYAYTLEYIAGVAHLSGTTATTPLLLTAPGALFYGSLLEAAPFIDGEARVPLWKSFFDDAVAGARRRMFRLRTSGGPLRQRGLGATP